MSNRRSLQATLPEPDRASDAIIERCRAEIESPLKRKLRALLLPRIKRRYKLAELGEGFQWPSKSQIRIGAGSRIGRYAYLGHGFEAEGQLVIGDLCMVSADVAVVGADHAYDQVGVPSRLAFPGTSRPVTVLECDVFIGRRVVLMEGITIGRGAVIGSGSVVTRNVEPYSIVAGVPAKLIKRRFPSEAIEAAHHAAIAPSSR